MRILLLCHAYNGLTQRLLRELQVRTHQVSVEFDISHEITLEACKLFQPDLIIAPFLKRLIPATIWQHIPCLIVHPGVVGDRGPSALDWAILNQEQQWGVTVLQANGEADAGAIWAHAEFAMRPANKSSLYRHEVTQHAVTAVLDAVDRFADGEKPTAPGSHPARRGMVHRLMRQLDRSIDWQNDDSACILRKIHSADGQPGLLDQLFGIPCYLYDAHALTPDCLQGTAICLNDYPIGTVIARRNQAVLRRTRDSALWIAHARLAAETSYKLPVAMCFPHEFSSLPDMTLPPLSMTTAWNDIQYSEEGEVGHLRFDFYNGAMSTTQCQRLRQTLACIKQRTIKVLVLSGGREFFSNGIHLNVIEAHSAIAGESAADESWRNIQAMNDICLELIHCTSCLTIAAMHGNAGAGGAYLALACDQVWAHNAVMLNPHYKNMGNLYGSEYWTYLLPKRVGFPAAKKIMQNRQAMRAQDALTSGLLDQVFADNAEQFAAELKVRAQALANAENYGELLHDKRQRRFHDEQVKPLQAYRDEELAHMHRNFFGFDPSYHIARHHFVYKTPHAWTPRHLAIHRNATQFPASL